MIPTVVEPFEKWVGGIDKVKKTDGTQKKYSEFYRGIILINTCHENRLGGEKIFMMASPTWMIATTSTAIQNEETLNGKNSFSSNSNNNSQNIGNNTTQSFSVNEQSKAYISNRIRWLIKEANTRPCDPKTIKQIKRQTITYEYVKRLHRALTLFDEDQSSFFKSNPEELIRLGIIGTAFSSAVSTATQSKKVPNGKNSNQKTTYYTCLNDYSQFMFCSSMGSAVFFPEPNNNTDNDDTLVIVGSKKLDAKHFQNSEDHFLMMCEVKECIQNLQLGPDKDHAWSTLMNDIIQFLEDPENEIQENHVKNELSMMLKIMSHMSSSIVSDEIFQQLWKNSVLRF